MVEDKSEAKKQYRKEYYDLNKQRMIKQIMAKQKMIRNSDKYIEDNRDKLIEELKDGRRKFLQMAILAKYNININPKTLKYDHDAGEKQPKIEEEAKEEETITEAIEQEPEAIPPTEAHRMMATMIKQYAKEYIEAMEEKPKTEEDTNSEDATN